MSFGKDRSVLNSIPSFADQHRRHESAQPKRGGGGGNFSWKNRFNPTDTATGKADIIRLFRGEHIVEEASPDPNNEGEYIINKVTMSYFPYVEHGTKVMGKFRSSVCSAGPIPTKDGRQPCIGCDKYWEGRQTKQDLMSRMSKYAFTLIHFHPYALVPDKDDKGNVREGKNGKPYMSWVRTTPHLLRTEHHGCETRDYNLMHWSLGWKDFQELLTQSYSIARRCVKCVKGEIETLGYCCRQCGSMRIDTGNTSFTEKDIEEMLKGKITCAECKNEDFLLGELACSNCESPTPADIFDVDLHVKQPLDPKTAKRSGISFVGFSEPGPVDVRYLSGEEPAFHQLDLAKIFAPTPIDEQKHLFLSASAPTVGTAARSWGNKPRVV